MENLSQLEDTQLDGLKEVANIGAGHAATALSQLTERRIMISVPEIRVTRVEEVSSLVGQPDDSVIAVMMHMLGDLTGRTLFILPDKDAKVLCDFLTRRPAGTTDVYGELEKSGLKEAGNIIGSAYLNALSDFMGLMLMPSVPSLEIDQAGAILTSTLLDFGEEHEVGLLVETEFCFREDGSRLEGHFLFLPDVTSINAILEAIRLR